MTDTIKTTQQTIMIRFGDETVKLGEFVDALSEFSRNAEVFFSDTYGAERTVNSVVFEAYNNKVIIDKTLF